MYTRSYKSDDERIALPSGYDGTAFEREIKEIATEKESCEAAIAEPSAGRTSLFSGLPFLKGFRGLASFKLPMKPGSEELILIGLALLLFFSKEVKLMLILMFFSVLNLKINSKVKQKVKMMIIIEEKALSLRIKK